MAVVSQSTSIHNDHQIWHGLDREATQSEPKMHSAIHALERNCFASVFNLSVLPIIGHRNGNIRSLPSTEQYIHCQTRFYELLRIFRHYDSLPLRDFNALIRALLIIAFEIHLFAAQIALVTAIWKEWTSSIENRPPVPVVNCRGSTLPILKPVGFTTCEQE
jgi:hypothetical protein